MHGEAFPAPFHVYLSLLYCIHRRYLVYTYLLWLQHFVLAAERYLIATNYLLPASKLKLVKYIQPRLLTVESISILQTNNTIMEEEDNR